MPRKGRRELLTGATQRWLDRWMIQ